MRTSRRSFLGKAASLSAFFIVPRHVLGGPGFLAPSDRISLGFIGTGKQSRSLLRSFLDTDEANIVAAAEVYRAKRQLFIDTAKKYFEGKTDRKYNEIQPYDDFREILSRKDIDAVVISTPDHWHAVHAVMAAEAGKDIYCEKPLSLTIREGRAMVNATRKYKRVFQTGSMQRSWPEFRQTAELIRNGYLGELKSVKVSVGGPPDPYRLTAEPVPDGLLWDSWLGPNQPVAFNHELAPPLSEDVFPRWRYYREFGGGGMTDWGAHMFDIVQWALDKDDSGPVRILPPDGKGNPNLTFVYENGLKVTHEHFGINNAIRFIGSEGQLDVQRRKLETTPASLKDKVIGPSEKHVYKSENHYKDFLAAIRNRTRPICDVEVGHRTASVCTLGNLAYELKRPLDWDPKKEKFKNDTEATARLGRELRPEWKIRL